MNEALQDLLDLILESSLQQWLLRAAIVLSPIAAVLAVAGADTAGADPGVIVFVAMMALTAMAVPDSQLPTIVIAAVAWHWLARIDTVGSAWLPVAAICLVVHHTAAAMAATIPTGGELPRAVIRRWGGRLAACGGLVVFVWIVSRALERREADGSGLLLGAALVIAAGLALLIRSRSLGRSHVS